MDQDGSIEPEMVQWLWGCLVTDSARIWEPERAQRCYDHASCTSTDQDDSIELSMVQIGPTGVDLHRPQVFTQ